MTVRQWGYACFAAFADDEPYGRSLGVWPTRAEAESVVAQAIRVTSERVSGIIGGAPAGSARTLKPADLTSIPLKDPEARP